MDTLCLSTLSNKLLSEGGSVPALWEFSVHLKFLSLWEDVVIYLFIQNACLSSLSVSQTNIVGMCTIWLNQIQQEETLAVGSNMIRVPGNDQEYM